MNEKKLILASGSPRRREILESAGYIFSVTTPESEEVSEGESPQEIAKKNSYLKSLAALKICSGVIICADTVVALDGTVLGKPRDEDDAKRMLTALSGREHSVFTGFTVTDGEKTISDFCETKVKMRPILADEIDGYIATKSPLDKAGAYGIQDAAGMFVTEIVGDYYNVVGLPISRISEILRSSFGIRAFMK
ncbi:MAG: septum formation protein Maf [Ruminococcaceae bacterium]|nr:septum formation protein Maf [Oscillospiraceae bacterium]